MKDIIPQQKRKSLLVPDRRIVLPDSIYLEGEDLCYKSSMSNLLSKQMGFDTGHILLNSGDRRLLAKAHEVEYDDSYSDEVWLQYCMAAVTHDFQTFQPSKTPLIQDSSFLARTASNMAARGMSPEKLEPYLQMYNNFPDFKKVIKVHCSDADRKKRLEYRKNHGEKVDYVDEQVGTPWYKKKEEALDEILEWRYGKDKIIDFDNSGMTPQEATAELKKIIEHGR